jgi:UDP-N-acetyl-D-galactosamine dehydrogenase
MSTIISIIGLGYVGLPLSRLLATKYPVIGFDINHLPNLNMFPGLLNLNQPPNNRIPAQVPTPAPTPAPTAAPVPRAVLAAAAGSIAGMLNLLLH